NRMTIRCRASRQGDPAKPGRCIELAGAGQKPFRPRGFARRVMGVAHMTTGSSMRAVRIAALLCPLLILACDGSESTPGQVPDEATKAGRDAASFPAAADDYFHDMDGGFAFSPEEIKGRNTWLVWTGGNDRFWDRMTVATVGAFDLLKTLSSFPYCDSQVNPNPPPDCDNNLGHLPPRHRWHN